MKKLQVDILTLCLLVVNCLLPISSLISQAPQGLNYQAVARNSDGTIQQAQNIGIRFTITNGNGGSLLYQETHSTATNEFGLFSLIVGNGSVVSGTFSSIDWANVSPWLEVEMDQEGGTAYVQMGASPLLSVPYALFAARGAVESIWETSGTNIYFDNYVGIGTETPTAPLSIETGLNEAGISHTNIGGTTTITSKITEIGASVGTESEDVFSLNAGGEGKVHIWPDGDVAIGEESIVSGLMNVDQTRMNPFESKLTVVTPLNETGFTHIGGDNQIIVNEAIGGVSASLGTMTDNTFRLKTNALGRLHILGNGQVTISPNDYAPQGQFTVYTANNTNGLVQVGGDGQVLAMRIGGSSGSIGTWTPHVMRLISNGLGRMDIRENGQIVIGPTDAPPHGTAKFTVHTENNTDGLVQVGGDGQVLAMRIGGSSGSIGTWTNHIMRIVANGAAAINIDPAGNVAIGTPDPLPGYKLSVNGNMKSKELVIETVGWPDYVFNADYKLSSLNDLETYINKHKHLPNIPAATEIEEHGLPVGDIQKRMMEKIEELTLHIIQLNKRIESLESHHRP